MNKKIELYMSIALLFCAVFLARWGALFVQKQTFKARSHYLHTTATEELDSYSSTEPSSMSSFCIVVDAGHGGADPGKIGVNGALEKDINLITRSGGKIRARERFISARSFTDIRESSQESLTF